ncbi:recombinase family protein [Gottfriedia acidiceleris]|uniref:recombinase family protein n=1 Tax=Gottfriedia acidiceleris TaxID=371036 RepID=UPI00300073A5
MLKKVIAYYRNSTDQQENSIQTQKFKALSFAIKEKIIIDEEIEDPDTSARKLSLKERSGISKVLELIKYGLIDGIIVYKRDRLARNVEEHLYLYQIFRKYNIKVYFTSENEIPMYYSPIGEYIETILGAMAEHEGKQIAQRILETRIANYVEGIKLGNLPYGYKEGEIKEGKPEIIVINEEKEIIQGVFNTILHGNHDSLKSIYSSLKKKGIMKKNQESWSLEQLKRIVENFMYTGTRIMNFGNEPFEKKYKDIEIIPLDEWNRANEIFSMILENKENKVKFRCPFLKFLYCKECKQSLSVGKKMKSGINYRIVRCVNEKCKNTSMAFLEDIEKFIKGQAKYYFQSLLQEHSRDLFTRQQKENIKRLHQLIEKKQRNVQEKENEVMKYTERYLKDRKQIHKEELIGCYRKLKVIKGEIECYYRKLEEIKSFMGKIKEVESFFYSDSIALFEEQEECYSDIIDSIYLGKIELDLYFRHPFLTAKEVLICD